MQKQIFHWNLVFICVFFKNIFSVCFKQLLSEFQIRFECWRSKSAQFSKEKPLWIVKCDSLLHWIQCKVLLQINAMKRSPSFFFFFLLSICRPLVSQGCASSSLSPFNAGAEYNTCSKKSRSISLSALNWNHFICFKAVYCLKWAAFNIRTNFSKKREHFSKCSYDKCFDRHSLNEHGLIHARESQSFRTGNLICCP